MVNGQAASAPDPTPLEPGTTPKLEAPRITLINAATFVCACKLEGSVTFRLDLASLELSSHAASVPETYDLVDLLDVPEDYHNFTDVFSKANTLAPNRPYDLKITLDGGKEPPQPSIYLLLTSELKTPKHRLHSTFMILTWSTHSFHQKERWLTLALHWFPCIE